MEYKIIPCPEHDVELKWQRSDYLNLCDDGKTIILIGYRVALTRHEYGIIKLLYDAPEGVSSESIIEKCFKNKDITVGNVAVHVYNINKKAMPVIGRRLVVGDRKQGYKIAENI